MSATEITKANGSLATPPTNDNLQAVKEQVEFFANAMADELKSRFENPEKVKAVLSEMTTADILEWCMKILRTMKQNQILLPGKFNVNMQQVNNYAVEMAESEQRRTQLRKEARKQLRYKPS